jgi:hypothetical protein
MPQVRQSISRVYAATANPNKQHSATDTIVAQAELLSERAALSATWSGN